MAINFGILNPNIPLAAGRTADLGKAMSTAEAIIGAKNRNKLLEMQMAEFPANAPVRELARVQAQNELDRIESGQLTPEQMEENRKLLGNLTLAYRALAGSDNREAFAGILASAGDRGNGPWSKMIQIAQAGVEEAMQTGDWSRVDAQSEQIMGMFQSDKEPSAFMEKVIALADAGMPWPDAVRQVALGKDAPPPPGFRLTTPEEERRYGGPGQIDQNSGRYYPLPDPGGEAGGVRERKISDTMRLHSLTEAQAQALVDGLVESVVSDKTGKVVTLNHPAAISGTPGAAVEQPFSAESYGVPEPQQGQTIVEQLDNTTGPVAVSAEKVQQALEFFGINTGANMTSGMKFAAASFQGLIRAMATNPDGRVLKEEMTQIRDEFGIPSSFWTSPENARQQAVGLDRALRVRMEQARATMENPNMPEKLRERRAIQYEAIRNFLPVLGVDRLGGNVQRISKPASEMSDEELLSSLPGGG